MTTTAPPTQDARATPVLRLTRGGRTALLVCAWSGPLVVVVAFAGWLVAGVLPFPLGPNRTPAEVVAFYAGGVHVPLGIALASVGVGLVSPLIAGITLVMRRGDERTPVLTAVQLVTGVVTAMCLLVPMLIMATAGFRPERMPDVTVALNDLAWLLFITPIAPFIIQDLAIAAHVLTRPRPLLPRWIGFLNLFVAFSFSFDVVTFAFRSGPFAWNGFLIFWLALTTYAIWLVVMCHGVRRAALAATVVDDEEGGP